MKFNRNELSFYKGGGLKKFLSIMKLTWAFILFFNLQMSASVWSQTTTMSLKLKNSTMQELFTKIEKSSGYRFFYNNDEVDINQRISVDAEDKTIGTILETALKGLPYSFKESENKLIVIERTGEVNNPLGANAQQSKKVTGKVTDSTGGSLPGVSVVVKGTNTGVITDNNGNYSLSNIPENATLQFSFVGMEFQEIVVGTKTTISITLIEATTNLDEVVAIGYGKVKRSDLTSSISTVGKKELETRVSTNPLQSLAAKVPGLNIYNNNGNPGGDISFNIRGFSSINGSNTPLVLVDGVITTNLSGYSSSDFESVSVLKDASATAIYGARGSNGVILMTTKKAKNGDFNINYDGNVSVGIQARHIDMLDANGYMEMFKRMWEYDPARGSFDSKIKPRLHTDYPLLFDANSNPIYNTDWQKASLKTAISNHHYLSITQGNEKSKSGIFLGYNNEQGLVPSDYQKKYTYRFNSEYNLRKWLIVGGELNGWSVNQQIRSNQGVGGLNYSRTLLETPPILPVQFPDGKFATFRDWGYNTSGNPEQYYSQGNNPVAQSNNSLGSSPVKASNLRLSLYTTLHLLKGLDFKSIYTNETTSDLNYAWNTYTDIDGIGLGSASGSVGRTSTWTSDNFITYDETFGSKHHITALLGSQWSSSFSQSLGASSSGYTTEFYQYNNLGIGSQPSGVSSGYSSYKTNSYFGRLNYVYYDKYLVTLNSRYDGSSVFGANNKYAMFPSGALGWVL